MNDSDRSARRREWERKRNRLWSQFVSTTLRLQRHAADIKLQRSVCKNNKCSRRVKSRGNSPSRHLARWLSFRLVNSFCIRAWRFTQRLMSYLTVPQATHLGHTHFLLFCEAIGRIRERVCPFRAWPVSVRMRWRRWTPSGPRRTPELLMEPCLYPPHDTHLPRPHLRNDITMTSHTCIWS